MPHIKQFIEQHNGKPLDFDGHFGFQCMDLAQFYNRDIVKATRLFGNAIDQWVAYPREAYRRMRYSNGQLPSKGDVIIWGKGVGQFGHIGIGISSSENRFISFDQNWPLGSKCHKQEHSFNGVLGWLRPLVSVTPPAGVSPELVKNYFRKTWGVEPAFGDWRYFWYRANVAKNIVGEADVLVKMDYWYGRVYDRITGQLNPDGDKIWQREKAKYPL